MPVSPPPSRFVGSLKKFLIGSFMILAGAAIGVIAGLWAGDAWAQGAFVAWQNAALPGDQLADRFLVGEGASVYVVTVEKEVYAQALDPDRPLTWVSVYPGDVGESPGAERGSCRPGEADWLMILRPPGAMRERLECLYNVNPEHVVLYRYAILKNGSVWRWSFHKPGLEALLTFLSFILVGAPTGGICGWLLYWVLVRAWGRRDEALEPPTPSLSQRWSQFPTLDRPTQPFVCPNCGQESYFNPWQAPARCPECGYKPPPLETFLWMRRRAGGMARTCERCGREIGPELRDCPERQSGRCPFTLEREGASGGGCTLALGWGMFALGMVALLGILFQAGEDGGEVCIAVPFAGFFLLTGAGLVFGRRETLRNPQTGAMWQRHTLFGLETDGKLVIGLEPLDVDLTPPSPFDDPVSIVALGLGSSGAGKPRLDWFKYATDIVEATLIGLWAQGLIEVYNAHTYRSYLWSGLRARHEYLLAPGERSPTSQVDGSLERRILSAMENFQPYYSPRGISIYDMVRAAIRTDRGVPSYWLIQEIQKEASERGLGAIRRKGLSGHFEPDPAYAARLEGQLETLRELRGRLARTHPSLLTAFQVHIARGIRSRSASLD